MGFLDFDSSDHAEADRAAARYHDDIVELDVRPLHRVQRARERLGECRVGGRQLGRDLVDESVFVVDHVLGHAARRAALEAEHVVWGAHPVLAVQAVATLPTGHDLLGDNAVANRDSPARCRDVIQLNNCSDEFVAGNHLGLGPGWTVCVSPELRRTVVALQVAGADARRLNLDQCLTWSWSRDGDFFQLVVLRAVADNGLHRVGDLIDLIGRGFGHASLHAASRGSEITLTRYRRPAQSGR